MVVLLSPWLFRETLVAVDAPNPIGKTVLVPMSNSRRNVMAGCPDRRALYSVIGHPSETRLDKPQA